MKTLYIADLDGTLLHTSGELTDFTRSTINALVSKGLPFTLDTARSISAASSILKHVHLKLPAVMMNGVCLTDTEAKKQVSVCGMTEQLARRVAEIFMRHGRPPLMFTFSDDLDVQYLDCQSQYERDYIADRTTRFRSFKKVDKLSFCNKVVFFNCVDTYKRLAPIYNEIKLISEVSVSFYQNTYNCDYWFLEIFSGSAGKWQGAKRLAEMYGFDRIVAFGDNKNDIEMLKNADVGIAVANAYDEVKAAADLVIDSCDEDAVAKYLLIEWANMY